MKMVYAHTHMHVHAHTHANTQTCTHTHVHAHMHAHTHTQLNRGDSISSIRTQPLTNSLCPLSLIPIFFGAGLHV